MKTNKTLKKAIFASVGIFVLLFAILVFHIITVKPAVVENSHIQVSRIDFKNDLDAAQIKQIKNDLRSLKGITSDSIIVKGNVVVYFHNNTITNSEKVFAQLMNRRSYEANRYILPANLANKEVCPIDRNSFSYKLSKKVNQYFN
jgi:predicted PurR-regulated permease PerM